MVFMQPFLHRLKLLFCTITWLAVTYICLKSNFCDFVGCNLSASLLADAYSYPTLFKPILTRCRYFISL